MESYYVSRIRNITLKPEIIVFSGDLKIKYNFNNRSLFLGENENYKTCIGYTSNNIYIIKNIKSQHNKLLKFAEFNHNNLSTPIKIYNTFVLYNYYKYNLYNIIYNKECDDFFTNYEWKLSCLKSVCSAMIYLFEHNFTHNNINPKNIMVNENGKIFLTDPIDKIKSIIYTPPEIIFNEINSHYNESTDMYSFAIFTNELFTGKNPKGNKTDELIIMDLIKNQNYRPIIYSKNTSIRNLIEIGWHTNPNNRFTFKEMLNRLNEIVF